MRKYIVHYGYGNKAYTDTRNARVLCRMYGGNVTVTTVQGKLNFFRMVGHHLRMIQEIAV